MQMENKIINSVPITFESIENTNNTDSRFVRVKVWICNIGENYNGSYFSKEVLTQMATTLPGIPIVGYIGKNKYKEIDFRSHEEQLIIKDDEYKFEYLGFAYGFIPNDNHPKFESKIGDDGIERTYLTSEGLIWTKWTDVIDIFESGNWKKSHSMELLDGSIEGSFNSDDNLFHFSKCCFEALCVLGDDISPAVESSCITKFSMFDIKSQITNMINEYNNFSTKEAIANKSIVDISYSKNKEMEENLMSENKEIEVVEVIATNFENTDFKEEEEEENEDSKEESTETSEEEKKEDKENFEEIPATNMEISEDEENDMSKKFEEISNSYTELQTKYTDLETKYSEMCGKYEEVKTNIESMSDYSELKEYKTSKEVAEKEEMFSQFSTKLTDEEIKSIKDESVNLSISEIEVKLFALIGKKNFSRGTSKQSMDIGIVDLYDKSSYISTGKSYDDILNKHITPTA